MSKVNHLERLSIYLLLITGIVTDEIILFINLVMIVLYMQRNRLSLNRTFALIIGLVIFHGFVNALVGNTTVLSVTKQIVGISLSFLCYSNILRKTDVRTYIRLYLNVVLFLSIIVCIQQVAYIFGISFLYDFSWLSNRLTPYIIDGVLRASALINEPASYSMVTALGMFVALHSIINRNFQYLNLWKALIVIIAYFLTFSSTGYIGIIVAITIIFFDQNFSFKKVAIFICVITVGIGLYTNVPMFQVRVNDTIALLNGGDVGDTNLSSDTLIANGRVMVSSLINTIGLGAGIGSHPISYAKYIDYVVDVSSMRQFLNVDDANSLLFRLLSELGVWGCSIVLVFLWKYRVRKKNTDYRMISSGLLTFFILKLLRSGHYFYNGLFLFVVLYYLCYRQAKKKEDNVKEAMKSLK